MSNTRNKISRYAKILAFGGVAAFAAAHGRGNVPSSALLGENAQAATVATVQSVQPISEGSDLNIFARLAKRAVPSVVSISAASLMKTAYPADPQDLFKQFFGDSSPFGNSTFQNRPRSRTQKAIALGSGFVVDSSGIIMTNNHVVEGADEVSLRFTEDPTEKPTEGKVVARDPDLDIALIRVKTSRKLEALPLGDSDVLQVGEYVMAVGNPYGNGHSVTHGIVSAKGRDVPGGPLSQWLQVDAPINPGNSGGPLLNLHGEVVGINNAIDPRAQGIGFAIPINYVKRVLSQLETKGHVDRGYIGAIISPLSPEVAEKIGVSKDLNAPFVTQVTPGSPAEKAGLRPYDVITEVDHTAVHTPDQLVQAVTSVAVGKSVPIRINRGGSERTLSIVTALRPTEQVASNENEDSHEVPGNSVGLAVRKAPQGNGVVVAGVEPGSAAEEAGIRGGDVILEVDRKAIHSTDEFQKAVQGRKSCLLRIKRSGPDGNDLYSVVVLEPKKDVENG